MIKLVTIQDIFICGKRFLIGGYCIYFQGLNFLEKSRFRATKAENFSGSPTSGQQLSSQLLVNNALHVGHHILGIIRSSAKRELVSYLLLPRMLVAKMIIWRAPSIRTSRLKARVPIWVWSIRPTQAWAISGRRDPSPSLKIRVMSSIPSGRKHLSFSQVVLPFLSQAPVLMWSGHCHRSKAKGIVLTFPWVITGNSGD